MLFLRISSLLILAALMMGDGSTALAQAQGQPQNQQSVPWNNPQAQTNARQQQANEAAQRQEAINSRMRMQEATRRAQILNSRKPGAVLPVVLSESELTPKERETLAPSPEDKKTYADFLRQRGTGIFRLMRVDKLSYGKVVKADDPATALPVYLVGGGAHYSFTKLNHDANKWSDICWKEEDFHAGIGGESLGVLVELGDVRLEEVNDSSKSVEYLTNLVPADKMAEAEQQFQRFEQGVAENGFNYRLSVPWKLNTTYALRSVNYGRSDILVTFRVVRQDANESLIILWKKLKTYSTPALKKK
jgi:hypothetical protein